ncbi:MAG: imidazole glycerol phosphate synthase subunit HisF [Caulobacterales bacterium]
MTLAARIIPCLDVKDGRVVKGVNFVDLKDAGDPVEQASLYDSQSADEICFLDITASHEKRDIMIDVVKRTADTCFMPLTVGGGIRSVDDVRTLLLAGADKVAIQTAAVQNPDLIDAAAGKFGAQAIVIVADCKRVGSRWEVFTHGGRNPSGKDAIEFCVDAVNRGAGELMVTSMDKDGTRDGYDLELLYGVTSRVKTPVIASGGAGNVQHLVDAIVKGGASAVLAASIFHFGTHTIAEARAALAAAGVPQRRIES